jgi:hypothetical protein
MGVDPLSLALLGGSIFASTQAGRKTPKPKTLPPPADVVTQEGPTETKRRRRGSLLGQAQIMDAPLG